MYDIIRYPSMNHKTYFTGIIWEAKDSLVMKLSQLM